MSSYNYLPLGYDCSPTAALRDLGLRKFSLPFDWVQSNHSIIMHCIDDKFRCFHKNVILIRGHGDNKQRLIDHYGLEYPHDYPVSWDPSLNNMATVANDAVVFEESIIIDTYKKYHDVVLEKYRKRIERFYHLLEEDDKPIIVLMRELFRDAMLVKDYLENKFKRKNIMFVVATDETGFVHLPHLMTLFNPSGDEKQDLLKWKAGIDKVKHDYEKLMMPSFDSGHGYGSGKHHSHHVDKHGHRFF